MCLVAACDGSTARPPTQSATGVVIRVDGPSAAEVTGFALRTNAGDVHEFVVGTLDLNSGGLPAPHLRDHLVSGEPITVGYTIESGRFIAVRYIDA